MSPTRSRIQRIEINGFRSLHQVRLELSPSLSVLIGANGAGKSNLVRCFEMVSWMLKGKNLAEFVTRHGGGDDQLFMGAKRTPRMDATIAIDSGKGLNEYRFGLAHVTAGDQLMFVDEAYRYSSHDRTTTAPWIELEGGGKEARIIEAVQDPQRSQTQRKTAQTVRYLLRNCSTYQFHDTSDSAPLRRPWDQSDNAFLLSHGGNLPAVLLRLQETDIKRYRLIEKQIARVLAGFGGFELHPVAGKVALRWRLQGEDKTFGAHLTSDGSLRVFALITLLNLPPDMLPDVLFLDEPELGLHPYAIELIASMLRRVSAQRQVIIATQSPALVDHFDLEQLVVVTAEDGKTKLDAQNPNRYQHWLEDQYSNSDLWTMNVLRPNT